MIDKKVTLLFIVGLKAPVICPRFEQQKTMWKKDKGGINALTYNKLDEPEVFIKPLVLIFVYD